MYRDHDGPSWQGKLGLRSHCLSFVLVKTQDQVWGASLILPRAETWRCCDLVPTRPFGCRHIGFAGRLMSTVRENPSGNGRAISNACVAPQFQASVLVMPQVPVTSKSMTATF
jgi:hypothetical protein